ncbi:MAG: hypothetical protein IH991_14770 [Planctomycetes bacterium]|nr:hypothetical protein [Planctomycetota bacterium]
MTRLILVFAVIALLMPNATAKELDVKSLVTTVRAVGPKGAGHRDAIAAMRELSKADTQHIPEILSAMDGAGKLATNWLRAAVESIAQRQVNGGGKLPVDELKEFVLDTNHSPRSRQLAFELIREVDLLTAGLLLPRFLNDPSLELRREAVTMVLKAAETTAASDKKLAIKTYRKGLTAARDLDQIKSATEALGKLGETVDLPSHFGFLMQWRLLGPFDNTAKTGFDMAYPPENNVALKATYKGKAAEIPDGAEIDRIAWQQYTTSDEYGLVDLNIALGKFKGGIAYVYTEFDSAKAQDADLRLGTANGNKIWLNGELLSTNHIYHARMEIDQYVGRGELKRGRNTILLKICQNEQTESWAQRWDFQLRVCNRTGTAILSTDRP